MVRPVDETGQEAKTVKRRERFARVKRPVPCHEQHVVMPAGVVGPAFAVDPGEDGL
jgi:hypothetical protein